MNMDTLFSETIAHAYIFSKHDVDHVTSVIEKKFDIKFGASQNAVLYTAENFGIEDSRAITELSSFQAEGETFVAIVARSLTPEAQHALLKTVEEPRPGMHFLIFVDNPLMLLPTLRSRCISISREQAATKKGSHPNFLSISLADRFAYIEKLAKNLKKDDPNAFRDAALEIFDTVILLQREKMNASNREQLERILELRNFLNDRGSSAKQLLETMAMQLG
jgi:DNA polymerase III delta prime subunit